MGNTFVITTDNELYGWGTSANLGLGTTTDAYYPVNIPMTGALAGKTIVKLDGVSQMVMLTQDGAVFGWGPNSNSLLNRLLLTFRPYTNTHFQHRSIGRKGDY